MIALRWACCALIIGCVGCGQSGSAPADNPANAQGAAAHAAQIDQYKAQAAKRGRPRATSPR